MEDIFDSLIEDIERGAFPYFYAKSEYRQNQHSALEHFQWLDEHLGEEEKAHLEKARAADVCLYTLEREALVRLALAMGIRLALSC